MSNSISMDKKCTKCLLVKSETEYYMQTSRHGTRYHASECKKCRAKRGLNWSKNNPEKRRESTRKFRALHWEEEKLRMRELAKTTRARWRTLVNSSKHKNIVCDISFEIFEKLMEEKCHYCGYDLPEYGYSLDRIHPKGAYSVGNVVPCCFLCNHVKSDKFTYEEMKFLGETMKQIKSKRFESTIKNITKVEVK